jgi:hypothetical protein
MSTFDENDKEQIYQAATIPGEKLGSKTFSYKKLTTMTPLQILCSFQVTNREKNALMNYF